jgi:hypothetical protein
MRRWGWLWLAAIALLWWLGEPSWVFGAIAFVPLVFLLSWRASLRNTVGRFRSRASPSDEVIFRDQDITISSALGSLTLPWTRFIDVWETPEFWMIFLAPPTKRHTPNHFILLPIANLPEEALSFLRARLPRTHDR